MTRRLRQSCGNMCRTGRRYAQILLAGYLLANRMRRHPRPLPGLQPVTVPVAGFRSPAGGPLSVLPPPPPSAWRFFLPASGKRRQQSAPISAVRRHRRPPSFGRGFYYGRWRRFVCHRPSIHRCPRSRLLLFRRCGFACALAAPAGEGVVPPELRPDVTTPAPPNCFFLPCRHHPAGSYFAASDHASSSPPAGYCQGRASVRLACVYAGSGAATFLAAACPGFASARRHPRPGERSSCRSGGSQPLLVALTTLSVCLGFVPTIQAGTRQQFGAASLSASTVPAHAAPRRITPRCCRSPARAKKAAAVSLLRW